MKRSFLSLLITLLSWTSIVSAPISPEQALERFFSASSTRFAAKSVKPEMVLKKEFRLADGRPAMYIFDRGNENGFVILSADDALVSLIGYSNSGTYNEGNLPPAFKFWLEEYCRQIGSLAQTGYSEGTGPVKVSANPDWKAIEPLLTTKWNQNDPYNRKCPEIDGYKCVTGCVATAMAQVMNYFKYPDVGTGTVTYTPSGFDQPLTLDLSQEHFNWDNMANEYLKGQFSDEQADAVATLMRACGYALEMKYGTGSSAAASSNEPSALIEYFQYDRNIKFVKRGDFSYDEWATMIYNNLKNIGPVIYDGHPGFGSGHSFVCDGYDGEGYFHINWGWGGYYDGYFFLDYLNPSGTGIGGGSGNYSGQQTVVLNIQPPVEHFEEKPSVKLTDTPCCSISGNLLHLGARYSNELEPKGYISGSYTGPLRDGFKLGLIFESEGNSSHDIKYLLNGELYFYDESESWDYYQQVDLKNIALQPDNRYKVTISYIIDDIWTPLTPSTGHWNYFYITFDGNEYTVENLLLPDFTIKSFEIDSVLYMDKSVNFKVMVENNSSQQLTKTIGFVMKNENGEGILLSYQYSMLTLDPGETKEMDYETIWGSWGFDKDAQDYPMKLWAYPYDPQRGVVYDYEPFPVTIYRYKPVRVSSIRLSLTNKDIIIGSSFQINATVRPTSASDKTINWTSEDESVATVDSVGLVTAVGIGECAIVASANDNSGVTARCFVNVKPILVESIDIDLKEWTGLVGETVKLSVDVTPENATDRSVSWSSTNTAVVTVDSVGLVTAVGIGECAIVASTTDNSGLTARCLVNVKPILVESIDIDLKEWTGPVGETVKLSVDVTPENATDRSVSWSSTNMAVATVDPVGLVTAIGVGECAIVASANDNSGVTARCLVNVKPILVESIDIDLKEWTGLVGETVKLSVDVTPENATDRSVSWSSTNMAVATVDSVGLVTAIGVGECAIVASANDNSGVTARCLVNVKPILVESIDIDLKEWTGPVEETVKLSVNVAPENATDRSVSWSSTNMAVATVDSVGLVTAIGVGECAIVASANDNSGVTARCLVNVKPILVESIDIDLKEWTGLVGETVKLSVDVTPENATDRSVSWSSTNMAVATVDSVGLVTAIGVGECEIVASANDNSGVTARCLVNVKPILVESIDIDLKEWTGPVEETVKLSVNVAPENATDRSVSWSSTNMAVATVDSVGLVTAIGVGECEIVASANDNSGVTARCLVNVKPILVESIDIDLKEWTGPVEETVKLSVNVAPENATDRSVSWSSTNMAVATVDSVGLVTAIGVGECEIVASANDDSGVTARCLVNVKPILVESLTIEPKDWNGIEGETFKISATVLPENATNKTLSWKTSDSEIATVDKDGNVDVHKPGHCIITVSTTDGSNISEECIISSAAGLTDIFADGESFDIYDLKGLLIKENCGVDGLKQLSTGIYIIRSKHYTRTVMIR